jgi:hypothetical protein
MAHSERFEFLKIFFYLCLEGQVEGQVGGRLVVLWSGSSNGVFTSMLGEQSPSEVRFLVANGAIAPNAIRHAKANIRVRTDLALALGGRQRPARRRECAPPYV